MKPLTVYVIGPTNAGKTTLLNQVREFSDIGLVEVGKMFRAKYPPSHFKGQANPAHTQDEAWRMFETAHAELVRANKRLIFVDGQPRTMDQYNMVSLRFELQLFVHLWAPADVREKRAIERDGADAERLALSLSRIHGDIPAIYDIVAHLLNRVDRNRGDTHGDIPLLKSYDTSGNYSPLDVLHEADTIHSRLLSLVHYV